jgi:phosphatidate cytidylyltransferase
VKRELVAAAAIPILVVTIFWLPPWGFLTILAAAALLACDEYLKLARAADIVIGRWLVLVLTLTLLISSWLRGVNGFAVAAVATLLTLPTVRLARPESPQGSLAGIAAECFAVLYLGAAAACLGWLRLWPEEPDGVKLLVFFLACIWVGDSGAYYVGKNLGRHKMSPRISPKKTFEGLAGGVATTYVAAAAAAFVLDLGMSVVHIAAMATILAVAAPLGDLIESLFAPLGDLIESLFKRDSGIKDSSHLLPGHGGFLDRTDSLFYSAPLVLGYLLLTGLVT